jgi:Methyltransferase domain
MADQDQGDRYPALTSQLRAERPALHGDKGLGASWPVLAWLESHLNPNMTTLETGSGLSTIVFAAKGGRHTAISPVIAEHEAITAWCAGNGIKTGSLQLLCGSSHEVLVSDRASEPLDVALIDGAHAFPMPILDWFFIAPHLKVGGHLLLDDAYQPSINMLVKYLRASDAWEMEGVVGHQTPCFRKLSDDWLEPAWDEEAVGRARFDYLPAGRRVKEASRHWLLKRSPFRRLVQRVIPLIRRS